MEATERRSSPSVQAQRKRDAKYLLLHSHNYLSNLNHYSVCMNESADASATLQSPEPMRGLKEAPSLSLSPSTTVHVNAHLLLLCVYIFSFLSETGDIIHDIDEGLKECTVYLVMLLMVAER